MVTKVGSAGHVVDSVIQYPHGSGKQADNSSNSRSASAKAEKKTERLQRNDSLAKPEPHKENTVQKEKDVPAVEKPNMELSPAAIKITVDDVNEKLKPIKSSVEFEYHEKTGRYSFRILDEEGTVLKEVPPKKSLDMVAKLFELAGILVDEKF